MSTMTRTFAAATVLVEVHRMQNHNITQTAAAAAGTVVCQCCIAEQSRVGTNGCGGQLHAAPTGTMVHTCHIGPYEELYTAWTELEDRLKNDVTVELKNLQKGDALFEIYTIGPETTSDTSQWRTDMYQTLKNV
jgi:hypothetical protein